MRFVTDTQKVARDSNSEGLQVLAAGLWRCATSSLQVAFEEHFQPGLAPSMHGAYIMPSVAAMKLCCAACRETNTEKRRKMLYQLFTGYNASSDYPGMAFADDLMDMYPGVKVVLNQRKSAEEWKESVDNSLKFFASRTYLIVTCWVPQSYWHYRVYKDYQILAKRRFGVDHDMFSEEHYLRHNEWVREMARYRGKEVLEWDPSVGWSTLSSFVGTSMPDGKVPQINEAETIRQLKRYLVARGLLVWCAITVVFAVMIILGISRLR